MIRKIFRLQKDTSRVTYCIRARPQLVQDAQQCVPICNAEASCNTIWRWILGNYFVRRDKLGLIRLISNADSGKSKVKNSVSVATNSMELSSSREATSYAATRILASISWNPYSSSPLVSILSQTTPPNPISPRSILMLSTQLGLWLPSDLFPTGFLTKNVQGTAEITPTFRKITVGSPKQLVGCGPFR
jgi:hypothetical protein